MAVTLKEYAERKIKEYDDFDEISRELILSNKSTYVYKMLNNYSGITFYILYYYNKVHKPIGVVLSEEKYNRMISI